jgi:GGDEF domain-containing protein
LTYFAQQLRWLLLGCVLVWHTVSYAVPQVSWDELTSRGLNAHGRVDVSLDLRHHWEVTRVGEVELANAVALDPDQIWRWPAQRFSSRETTEPMAIRSSERYVGRVSIVSQQTMGDVNLTIEMPRLDAAHLSYRVNDGAWTTLAAGDTLAMNRWPLQDKQPSFLLPLGGGKVDVVVQFAHRGVLAAPVLLQSTRTFLANRSVSHGFAGLLIGMNLALALMGGLLALNFRKVGFLAVASMSLMMALVIVFGHGAAAMLMGREIDNFNDASKFFIYPATGSLLPWVAAMVLGMRAHSRFLSGLATLMTIAGLVMSAVWVDYDLRDIAVMGVAVQLTMIALFAFFMIAWAWSKDYLRSGWVVFGLLLYPSSFVLLLCTHLGSIDTDVSVSITALTNIAATLTLMRGLYMEHRLGRQVLARTKISPMRDVLTGLLSRDGLQAHVYAARDRMQSQQTGALFLYIPVVDAPTVMQAHGEYGFDMGMVQIAASLSTSLSNADGVGRISRSAFGICVMMPPDPALATRLAQKILSRLMALASRGVPVANATQIALAWIPLNGLRVDYLERRCLETLQEISPEKRIAWVGGAQSHLAAAQMLHDFNAVQDTPDEPVTSTQERPAGDSLGDAQHSTLHDRIHRIEREMLHGMNTQFLVEEAERMSRELNEAHSQGHSSQSGDSMPTRLDPMSTQPRYAPTQQMLHPAKAAQVS